MKIFIVLMTIGMGGSIGALARHLASLLFTGPLGLPEYLAIMIVNILGCFLIGLVFFLIEGLYNKDTNSKLATANLSKPLLDKGWWPAPDPTQPVVRDFKADLQSELLAAFMITGILGGMTTFSLFSLISLNLAEKGNYIPLAINAVGTVALGWIATYFGLWMGQKILTRKL